MAQLTSKLRIEHLCVVGLGYVGLPLAKCFVESGYTVTGIDADEAKISTLRGGRSYLSDLTDAEIASLHKSGRFDCHSDYRTVPRADAIIICVPTPLNDTAEPDLSYMYAVAAAIAPLIRQNQLIVLESSTFPGTTRDFLVPLLEKGGLKAGNDFFVAYSPERIDPGRKIDITSVPKVIGGINEQSTQMAYSLYQRTFKQIVPVSSTEAAEFTKLLENTQRLVNISLMNEMSSLACGWGINLWESIQAANTKPYGFTVFYPGPGIGGHCIPVDPLYLQWKAEKSGGASDLIRVAIEINERRKDYVVQKVLDVAATVQPKILLIGVTYKKDVNDIRESPAVHIMEELVSRGASVKFHDPFVSQVRIGKNIYSGAELSPQLVNTADCVVILTDHSNVDYEMMSRNAKRIVDTRNVYGSRPGISNIVLI